MSSGTGKNKLLMSALWYAERKGWPVLALHSIKDGVCTCKKGKDCNTAGKHPRYHSDLAPNGALSATADPKLIQEIWKRWPRANVGIACGEKSFDALDIDIKGNGFETIEFTTKEFGALPPTIKQVTGSGGQQQFFKFTGRINNSVRFAPGLDTRSTGGLVVAPPSIHLSGNRYSWVDGFRPNQIELAEMPEWLIGCINAVNTENATSNGSAIDIARVFSGIGEGERDRELFRYACRLREKGLQRQEAEALIITLAGQCTPPFCEKEAIKKVAQAWKYPEGSKRALDDEVYSQELCSLKTINSNSHANQEKAQVLEFPVKSTCQQTVQMSANVSIVSAECQQNSQVCENTEDGKCKLVQIGFSESEATDIYEIYTKTCERDLSTEYLEHLLLTSADKLLTRADTSRHLLTSGNLTQDIRNWVVCSCGSFHITDIYRDLNITSRNVKLAAQKAIERLVSEKLIERFGMRKGNYRVIDTQCDLIDWRNIQADILPVKWPFGIEQYVKIMPGNIIAIAGEPNAGKTGFLLNVVEKNMHMFDVNYFSSEMGASEFHVRIKNFEPVRKMDQWKFKAFERSSNFGDVIKPGVGVVNIIDFMELHDDFWRIGGMMKEIHDKLKGAIAIVALQKNPGVNVGIGGTRGLEKPRLYLTMGPGWCKMVKAKNWATSENPNGLLCNYKLHSGCHFHVTHDWHREAEKGQ